MHGAIVVGIGKVGRESLEDLPDDPQLLSSVVAIDWAVNINPQWIQGEGRVPRFALTELERAGSHPTHAQVQDYALVVRLQLMDLLAEAPDSPLVVNVAMCNETETSILNAIISSDFVGLQQRPVIFNLASTQHRCGAHLTGRLIEIASTVLWNHLAERNADGLHDGDATAHVRGSWVGHTMDFLRLSRFNELWGA